MIRVEAGRTVGCMAFKLVVVGLVLVDMASQDMVVLLGTIQSSTVGPIGGLDA